MEKIERQPPVQLLVRQSLVYFGQAGQQPFSVGLQVRVPEAFGCRGAGAELVALLRSNDAPVPILHVIDEIEIEADDAGFVRGHAVNRTRQLLGFTRLPVEPDRYRLAIGTLALVIEIQVTVRSAPLHLRASLHAERRCRVYSLNG